ncbi:MAG: phosphatidylglycerophosphatase A family protein [Rhodospirillales bacterium]
MNPSDRGLPRSHPAWWIPCVGGIGLASKAPGTWGSLAALPPSYLIATALSPGALLAAALGVAAIGFIAVRTYLRRGAGAHDPQEVVIDEVAGQMIALSMLPPDLLTYAAGFVMFRLFDILKPFPVGWIDRNIGGAGGIMLDDVAAGIYALVVMLLAGFLAKQV